MNFKEDLCDKMCMIVVRKSARNRDFPHKKAGVVKVTVCMDERQKLQGKFVSNAPRKFFDSQQDEHRTVGPVTTNPNLVEDGEAIQEALKHGLKHNNLSIDLAFDEVSIILPNKHTYEVIYNRLGNDMLLWMPMIFSVKEHLYNQLNPDPLQDPDMGFSRCISGTNTAAAIDMTLSEHEDEKIYSTFPRTKSGHLTIHTDTCVSLAVNKGHVTICSGSDGDGFTFVACVDDLALTTVVGLEKDPEICLLSVGIKDGRVLFGHSAQSVRLPDLHFNSEPGDRMRILVQKTDFQARAWRELLNQPLLELTTKILFDSQTNFKTISLCMQLSEASVSWDVTSPPIWLDWLVDFFTVIEYPVVGYIPPAILTEMHFDLSHCTVDVTQLPVGRITLTLGNVKVNCSLLDTGKDASIAVTLEDVGLYMAANTVNLITDSICICDIDLFEVTVNLREEPVEELDVSLSCNLLRLRTCSDTLLILAEVAETIATLSATAAASGPASRESSGQPEDSQQIGDEVIPDLEDAMAELDEKRKASNPRTKRKSSSGAQVFFFPNEGVKINPYSDEDEDDDIPQCMTESMYVPTSSGAAPGSDDSLEDSFFFVDSVGTGTVNNGEATVRALEDAVVVSENHFAIPQQSINYLKTPKGFPKYQSRITLKHLSILWQIFGGSDFLPPTAIHLPASSPTKAHNFSDGLKTKGGPGRNSSQMLEISLQKISLQHEIYPSSSTQSSRQIAIVKSFEIRDRLATSDINKLLHLYSNKMRPRQSNANMLCLKCVNLKPDFEHQAEESIINVSLQPLRINIDQDTLFFIVEFFSGLFPSSQNPAIAVAPSSQRRTAGIRYSPGAETVEIEPEAAQEMTEDYQEPEPIEEPTRAVVPSKKSANQEIYIRSFMFTRDVPIRIDYSAKYVDLTQGALAGLLAGLTSLNCSELTLKKVKYQNGIVGVDRLLSLLVTEWLADIRQNQVPNILGGVGPMYSVLQLVQGIKDLFLLPIEQYQKDGRLIRGIQKGAHSFTSSTAMSFLDLTNKLLGAIKFAAELAFDIMSPEGTVVQGKLPHPSGIRNKRTTKIVKRPSDMREGVFNALAVVQEVSESQLEKTRFLTAFFCYQQGLDETARSLAEAAASEHARKGLSGAVGGILRQVPSTLVKPVILATTATTNVLEGVKNQVAPDVRIEEQEKWKDDE